MTLREYLYKLLEDPMFWAFSVTAIVVAVAFWLWCVDNRGRRFTTEELTSTDDDFTRM